MNDNTPKIGLAVILFIIFFIGLLLADEFLGQVWSDGKKGEYIVNSAILSNEIGKYVKDNNLAVKQYVYVKVNPQGKVTKFDTADTLDEILGKRNANKPQNGKELIKPKLTEFKEWKKGSSITAKQV